MDPRKNNFLMAVHQVVDLLIVTIAFQFAYITKIAIPAFGNLDMEYNYNLTLIVALISCHVSHRFFNVYENYHIQRFKTIFIKTAKAMTVGLVGLVVLSYLLHFDSVSRLLLCLFYFYGVALLVFVKYPLLRMFLKGRCIFINKKKILIIGTRQRAQEFIQLVTDSSESGYEIIGCIDISNETVALGSKVCENVNIIGMLSDFHTILKDEVVDEVIFALPLKKIENVEEYVSIAETYGINIRVLPDFQFRQINYYPQTGEINFENFVGIPTVVLSSLPNDSKGLLLKSCLDYLCALCGLVLFLPFFLVIAILIKLTSRGPVIFSQTRSGLNGRQFRMYKFRTMVVDAENLQDALISENEMDGPVFKMKDDPRITWIGSILRKTSLDELPQLINILKGDMSLVGPRPPVPSEVDKYKPWQRRRLSMKPGLTCIWQVNGRNNTSFEQWMNMDLEYIDNWSILLDFKLLLLTVKEVMVGNGR